MPKKTCKLNNNSSLARQLLFYILLFSSFFTLLASVVQLWVEYRKDLKLIETRIIQVKESYISSLSLSIWNMNQDHVYAQLNGILQLPEIACLEAITIDKTFMVGDKPPETMRISFDFPIVFKDPLKQFDPKKLGILTIYGDLRYIHTRLNERIVLILVTQAFKTFSVSIFILFIVWQLITRHLHTMADYVRNLHVNNLDEPLVLNRKKILPSVKRSRLSPKKGIRNELIMVTDAVNYMRQNLKKANETLIRNRDDLEEKVVQRTIMLEKQALELRDAKDAAEAANKLKSSFLANMSHEIRTPMNAILGFTEILSASETDNQKIQYFNAIESNSKVLLSLINDILDLSRIEAGKLSLEYSALIPEKMFNEIEILFAEKINKKGIEFITDISPEVPEALLLDGVRIRQIIINLVGNALKFTSQGYILLSMECHKHLEKLQGAFHSAFDISFSVEDSGMGIPPEEIDSVFETFTQLKGQKTFEHGGTGLGLAITRRLVELMNGSISVKSNVGEGSTFTVFLKDVESPLINPNDDDLNPGSVIDMKNVNFEPATILIVDDIDYNRELLKGFLKDYSNLVLLEAENGQQAVEMCQQFHTDLILMDMKMPVMDGYKASEILKNNPELGKIPVIAVTASAMKEDEKIIRNLCDAYLPKPVRMADFISILKQFLPFVPAEESSFAPADDKTAFSSKKSLVDSVKKNSIVPIEKDSVVSVEKSSVVSVEKSSVVSVEKSSVVSVEKNSVVSVEKGSVDSVEKSLIVPVEKDSVVRAENNSKIRIIFVDDEPDLVEIGVLLLQPLGYHVTGESDPLKVMALFEKNPDDFDLIITDLTMPGMTGLELASGVRKIKPEIPVILCSGFTVEDDECIEKNNINVFLVKPFMQQKLVEAIESVFS
ncbi:putative Histidine kinase [Desulfamplus magnetovallimortis]|uniref:histidine kinase n=1 Tax=Desulfamplus magnetovallimortis TaxID=1246637 RepID=A0A1W1HAD1_9BACT|nr:response regulator [Desulfamplus magnetovallimortis]SLM29441.1 putative Histidine kinase [Desulfamplus magnetovallimortis]